MKVLLSLLIVGFGMSATADSDLLKITAFYALNGSRGASELCGKVMGQVLSDYRIVVTADPKYNPGKYTILPGPDGNFCLILNTVTGRANVDLIKSGQSQFAVDSVADIETTRYKRP